MRTIIYLLPTKLDGGGGHRTSLPHLVSSLLARLLSSCEYRVSNQLWSELMCVLRRHAVAEFILVGYATMRRKTIKWTVDW